MSYHDTLSTQNPVRGGRTPNTLPRGSGITPPGYGEINYSVVCNPVYVKEQHITVIRRGPTMPPSLEMHSWDPEDKQDTGYLGGIILESDFYSIHLQYRWDGAAPILNIPDDGGDAISTLFTPQKELKKIGDEIYLHISLDQTDSLDLEVGYKVILKYNYTNSLGVVQTASVRGDVIAAPAYSNNHVRIKLTSTPFNFPLVLDPNQIYNLSIIKKDFILVIRGMCIRFVGS